MGKRTITFWDKQGKGSFSNGLSDGRFQITRDGSVIFRTHGHNASLRTPLARNVRITVRVGDRCSQTTTALRPTKTGLALP